MNYVEVNLYPQLSIFRDDENDVELENIYNQPMNWASLCCTLRSSTTHLSARVSVLVGHGQIDFYCFDIVI